MHRENEDLTPTLRERLAVIAMRALLWCGLDRIAYSRPIRWAAKTLLLRANNENPVRTIMSGFGKGLKLRILPATPRSMWMGTYEAEMQQCFSALIKPGMRVYDCGANIGFFAAIAARLVGPSGLVVAFEPTPESFVCLQEVGRLNNFSHLQAVPRALWHEKTKLNMARVPGSGARPDDHVISAMPKSVNQSLYEVLAADLDSIVFEQGFPDPDFMKIDVEGSEAHVLNGAQRILERKRPILLMEIHGAAGKDAWPILKRLGYALVNVANNSRPDSVEQFTIWKSSFVAFPPELTAATIPPVLNQKAPSGQ